MKTLLLVISADVSVFSSGHKKFEKFFSIVCFDACCPKSSSKSTHTYRTLCKCSAFYLVLLSSFILNRTNYHMDFFLNPISEVLQ